MGRANNEIELSEEEIQELVEARKEEIKLEQLMESLNKRLDRLVKQGNNAGVALYKKSTIGGAYEQYEFRKGYYRVRK